MKNQKLVIIWRKVVIVVDRLGAQNYRAEFAVNLQHKPI